MIALKRAPYKNECSLNAARSAAIVNPAASDNYGQRSAAVLVVFNALMPSTFVIVPVMIAIIVAFAVTVARLNDAARCKRRCNRNQSP
jgi:hypothetical protein